LRSYIPSQKTLGILLLLALAFVVRLFHIGESSLWLDEAYTASIANYAFDVLWISPYDPTPPLYYTIIKLVVAIFEPSEAVYRFPSALFGTVTVFFVFRAAEKLSNYRAAMVAAMLLTLSFYHIAYSQEARAYAQVQMFIAVSFYGLVKLWNVLDQEPLGMFEYWRRGGWIYCIGVLGALYSHNTSFFYWAGSQTFILALLIDRNDRRSLVRFWIITSCSIMTLWLPWALASLAFVETGGFAVRDYSPRLAFDAWRYVHGLSLVFGGNPIVDVLPALLLFWGLFHLPRIHGIAIFFVVQILASSIGIWAYSQLIEPIYMPRTILWGAMFTVIPIGVAVASLSRRFLIPTVLILGLISAGNAVYYFFQNPLKTEDWKRAASVFMSRHKPGDIILFRAPYTSIPFLYYLEGSLGNLRYFGWECVHEQLMSGEVQAVNGMQSLVWNYEYKVSSIEPPIEDSVSLWVVESHCLTNNWEDADSVFESNWRLDWYEDYRQMRIYRYVQ
jgi:uncharacterized membrane protein